MTCPKCGCSNPEESTFCGGCGCSLGGGSLYSDGDDSDSQQTIVAPGGSTAPSTPELTSSDSDSLDSDPFDSDSLGVSRTHLSGQIPPPAASLAGTSIETLAPGARLGDRYEIAQILGVGGMGVVYRARDLTLDRDVALKVIRPDMARQPGVMERFRREITLASKVTHKNILRIHDLGEAGGQAYISMNFVEGETLKALMKQEGTLPVEQAVPLAIQLCHALHAASEVGVVHRDLKPANILLDDEGVPYIADFGLSRSLETGETMTATGTILGTIDYMSPEQARGETPDQRGDIYSLGLILYQMLTGELPFRADTAISVMMKRVHEDAPKITRARAKVPPWLSSIVARALKRDPDERYQNAGEMARDLEAKHISLSLRRWRKPRTLLRAAAGLVVAVLIVFGAIRGVQYFLAQRAEQAATVAPKTSLALLPFRNATGDPGFDWAGSGIADLVRTDLQQTKALRLMGRGRVDSVLDGLKVGSQGDFRPGEVQRVTNLLGVENVLTGSLMKAGEQFRIEAVLHGPGGTETGLRVEGAGEDSIFTMADELSERIREGLGVGQGWGEDDRGVTDLSTASVVALRHYQEGLVLVRDGNHLEAATKLEAALDEDPEFGVARALLAETYDRLGYAQRAAETADLAAQSLLSASPYERARIQAVRARLDNDLDAAESAYRAITEITPNDAEAHFALGSVQEDNGDLQGALETLQKVVALDPRHPGGHYSLGRVLVKLGNSSEALNELNTSLGLYTETGNEEGRANVLNGIGIVYDDMARFDDARRYYQDSLEIRERIGDLRGVGATLTNIAILEANLGQYEEAIASASRAVSIGEGIGADVSLAQSYSNLGDIYERAGRPEDALNAYQDSLRILQDSGDEAGLAWNLSSIGYTNSILGRYIEAKLFLTQALEKSRKIGDKTDIIRSLIDIGSVEQIQGRYNEALKNILEGLTLAREIGHKHYEIVLSANLSNIHEEQGDYRSALQAVLEAEGGARDIGDTGLTADCLAFLGSVRRRLGDWNGASAALDEALDLSQGIGNVRLIAKIRISQGLLLASQGEREQALNVLRQAVEAADQARNHRLHLMASLYTAAVAGDVADLQEALQEADRSGLAPLEARAHLSLARLYLGTGKASDALEEAEQAIRAGASLQLRDVVFQAHHIAALALVAQARDPEALLHFTAGLELLEEMRNSLTDENLAHFVSREETTSFASDAEGAFLRSGKSQEAERLRQNFGS